MKSIWTTFSLVAASVLLLLIDRRVALLAVVAPVSILIAAFSLHQSKTTSVEYRRKR